MPVHGPSATGGAKSVIGLTVARGHQKPAAKHQRMIR